MIGCVIFLVFLCRLNQIEKVPLLSTKGRSFEKAVVTEVIKDNLEESGIRLGNQVVSLKILSGEFRGEEVPRGICTAQPAIRTCTSPPW